MQIGLARRHAAAAAEGTEAERVEGGALSMTIVIFSMRPLLLLQQIGVLLQICSEVTGTEEGLHNWTHKEERQTLRQRGATRLWLHSTKLCSFPEETMTSSAHCTPRRQNDNETRGVDNKHISTFRERNLVNCTPQATRQTNNHILPVDATLVHHDHLLGGWGAHYAHLSANRTVILWFFVMLHPKPKFIINLISTTHRGIKHRDYTLGGSCINYIISKAIHILPFRAGCRWQKRVLALPPLITIITQFFPVGGRSSSRRKERWPTKIRWKYIYDRILIWYLIFLSSRAGYGDGVNSAGICEVLN